MGKTMLVGTPISGSIGIGRICVLKDAEIHINREKIRENQIEEEITRLEVAIDKAFIEICDLSNELRKRLEKESNLIFEAYKSILSDKYFIKEIEDLIVTHRIFAENAVDICINNYISVIDNSGNDYARQSMHDIRDVGDRIIRNIIGGKNVKQLLDEVDGKKIIAVKCLTPWLAAALGKKNVRGIFCEEGAAYLSHSAIILRGLDVPAINGIICDDIIRYNNNMAVIDGEEGLLIVEPDESEIAVYTEISRSRAANIKGFFRKKSMPAITMDGHSVGVMANIGNFEECDDALDNDADGIGLVRTEILFINYKEIPNEKEQYLIYSKIIKKMRSKPVTLRTVDAGEDKIFTGFTSKMSMEKNNLRGIGYSLSHKAQFLAQIRSVLRISQHVGINLMFPMVNTVDEIREAKSCIDEEAANMSVKKEQYQKNLALGAVIESRQAIDNIDAILDEVNFISMGTNDLLLQVMGMSRKDSMDDKCEYLNPEFLGLIKYCIDKASGKGKPVSVCGEMAADPLAALLLIGMGVNSISMQPAKISKMKEIIRKINYSDTGLALDKVFKSNGINDTRAIVVGLFNGIIS